MISDAHSRLRDATQLHHHRLEDRVDLLRRIANPAGRRDVVERFHAFHTGAEAGLAPWLAGLAALDFETRRRTPWLTRDLAAMGGRPHTNLTSPVAPRSVSEALGLMYVLEGSTLGGRVIRRHVEAAGGDMAGLSFLDPYGDRVGERWRSFLAVLQAEARSEADLLAMTVGAVAGFQGAELQLCEAADA